MDLPRNGSRLPPLCSMLRAPPTQTAHVARPMAESNSQGKLPADGDATAVTFRIGRFGPTHPLYRDAARHRVTEHRVVSCLHSGLPWQRLGRWHIARVVPARRELLRAPVAWRAAARIHALHYRRRHYRRHERRAAAASRGFRTGPRLWGGRWNRRARNAIVQTKCRRTVQRTPWQRARRQRRRRRRRRRRGDRGDATPRAKVEDGLVLVPLLCEFSCDELFFDQTLPELK